MNTADSGIIPWMLAGVASVVGALASALVYIFRKNETENAKAIVELKSEVAELKKTNREVLLALDRCDDDRAKLFTTCELLKVEVQHLNAMLLKMNEEGTQFAQRKEEHK